MSYIMLYYIICVYVERGGDNGIYFPVVQLSACLC